MGWREELELEHIEQDVHGVFRLLVRVLDNQEQLMGALEDLQAADANLATEISAVLNDVIQLQDQIANLQTQVTAGVAPADLQPIVDDLNAQAARIATALAPPAPPA